MNDRIKQGTIIKGVGGFYTVLAEDGTECVCKARGLFRKQGVTPIVGDTVDYQESGTGTDDGYSRDGAAKNGYLTGIHPRKNEFIRPAVSNIDRMFIVISASRPLPDLLLVDKLLLLSFKLGVEPVVVINKCDEAEEGAAEKLRAQYAPTGCSVLLVSAETGEGIPELRELLRRKTVCFAGQSAVGKSSLLNALIPGAGLAVGGLSDKTERGRHTTRHTQLIPLGELGGAVLDTPGFSLLDTLELEPEEIRELYPELRGAEEKCRFSRCLHVSEPGCSVKKELIINEQEPWTPGKAGIHSQRYERYVRLVREAEEHRRHRYD